MSVRMAGRACLSRGRPGRISLPVGGIGTGTMGFGGRGQFRDWELENHPSKGVTSELTFLACRVRGSTTAPAARILEGTLFDEEVEGAVGFARTTGRPATVRRLRVRNHLPFRPGGLADPHFPVRARVEVFNPFVPGDEERSGLPIAAISVTIESVVDEPLECSVMFSAGSSRGPRAARSRGLSSRPSAVTRSGPNVQGYLLSDDAVEPIEEDWGTLAAAVLGEGGWVGPSWGLGKWNQGLLTMWRAFVASGEPAGGDVRGREQMGQLQLSVLRSPAPSALDGPWNLMATSRSRVPAGVALPEPPLVGLGPRARVAWPGLRRSATYTPRISSMPGTLSALKPSGWRTSETSLSVLRPPFGKVT